MTDLPYCECGCGNRVKRLEVVRPGRGVVKVRFYERACYSRSGARGHICVETTRLATYRRRRQKFLGYLERLGPKVTREDLLVVFQEIARDFKNRGINQEREAWRKQRRSAA